MSLCHFQKVSVCASLLKIMEKHQKRSTNFTKSEEDRLLVLVAKYKSSIENKKSDTNTNKFKREAWARIEREFNCDTLEIHRNWEILKRKYENLKKRTKSKFADEKKYIFGTGGGPSKSCQITNNDEIIKEIIGDQLTGRNSTYDCDIPEDSSERNEEETVDGQREIEEYQVNTRTNVDNFNIDEDVNKNVNKNNTTDMVEDETPSTSRSFTEHGSPKKTKKYVKGNTLAKRLCTWTDNKTQAEELKKDLLVKEHALKIQQMKEIHEIKLQQENEILKHIKIKSNLEQEEILLRIKHLKDSSH